MKIDKERVLLSLIITAGFILRIWGINFGLPFQFHQDEPIIVNHALAYGTGDFNPHFFAIPPLTSYILFIIYGLYFVMGRITSLFSTAEGFALSFFKDPTIFYILARFFIGVLPGTICIFLSFLLYRRLFATLEKPADFNRQSSPIKANGNIMPSSTQTVRERSSLRGFTSTRGAIFSAAIVSFCFLAVADSHYVYTDMMMMLFVILAMLQIVSTTNMPTINNYVISGLLIGISTAIKYNASILFVPFLGMHISTFKKRQSHLVDTNLILAIAVACVSFILANPFAIFDFKSFRDDLLSQANASGYIGWTHHIFYSLREGIGIPILLLGIGGMISLAVSERKKFFLVISFPLAFYVHLVFLSQPFPRYVIPIIPSFAILASYFIFDILLNRFKNPLLKKAIIACCVLGLLPLIIKSVKADLILSAADTRIEALEWIHKNINPNNRIAVDHTFFRPPLLEVKEQIIAKHGILNRQKGLKGIKDKKIELMLEATGKEPAYMVFFLSPNPEKEGRFMSTIPAIQFDFKILKDNHIDYIIINYANRQDGTQMFYNKLFDIAKPIARFSPYKDECIRMSFDRIATTSLPASSKEIFSRRKNGPALEIYRIR